jgi:uncharacterized protein (DUF305 family)
MALSQRVAAVSGAIALSVVLAACGGEDTTAIEPGAGAVSPPTTSSPEGTDVAADVSAEHNEADVAFVQGMIPHHRQAIEMSELAADRAESEEVTALADQISAAQGPEIETMTTLLEAWGEEVPEDTSMEGMDHGGTDAGGMSGMMTREQMEQLGAGEGADFDRMFLQMMISHHEGAIQMAQVEQGEGENSQAVELAEEIEAAQTEEIMQMQELLQSL